MNAKKQLPPLRSDEEAEAFVANADLTEYDLSGFRPAHFELAPNEGALHVLLPFALLEAVKRKAASRGIPYPHYVRMVLEADIAAQDPAGTSATAHG